jgi:hypothetical protein
MRLEALLQTLSINEAIRAIRRSKGAGRAALMATLSRDHNDAFMEQVRKKLDEPTIGKLISRG